MFRSVLRPVSPALPMLLAALSLTSACKEEEETHEPVPPKALFTADDLAVAGASALDQDSVEFRMNNSEDFYANEPAGSTLAFATSEACFDEAFRAPKARADDANYTVKAEIDLKECAAIDFPVVHTAKLSVVFWIGCPDGDATDFDGLPVDEGVAVWEICKNSEIRLLAGSSLSLDVDQVIEIQQEDGTTTQGTARISVDSAFAIQTDDASYCVMKPSGDDLTWKDGCVNTTRSVVQVKEVNGAAIESPAERSVQRLESRSIVETKTDKPQWFKSGAYAVSLHDWTGAVTYRGATLAPTYSLASGGVTVEGVVGQPGVSPSDAELNPSGFQLRSGKFRVAEPRLARLARRYLRHPRTSP